MHRLFLPAILAGFLLSGCTEEKQAPRLSTNVEDCRTGKTCDPIKPKTAYLLNGLLVYSKPGMMEAVARLLEDDGYQVTILNHTDARRLTSMPDVVVAHSKGANSFLKQAQKFKKNPPKLIITIDPGRLPQFSKAHPTARTVNIRCWYHPIGGQYIYGAHKEYEVCGVDHLVMPHDPRVLKIIKSEVEKLQ